MGATILPLFFQFLSYRFNSRTRVGATDIVSTFKNNMEVSIHAPVWVRPVQRRNSGSKTAFQFTHPCGCDPRAIGNGLQHHGFVSIHAPVWVRLSTAPTWSMTCRFQFTHPCGCDYGAISTSRIMHSFNSRTRVGATFPCSVRFLG